LTLFGRDAIGSSRAGRARLSGSRARKSSSHPPRLVFDVLEPRLLLNATTLQQEVHFLTLQLPPAAAMVASLERPSPYSGRDPQTEGQAAAWESEGGAARGLVVLNARTVSPTSTSMVVVFNPLRGADNELTAGPGAEDPTSASAGLSGSIALVNSEGGLSTVSGPTMTQSPGNDVVPVGVGGIAGTSAFVVGAQAAMSGAEPSGGSAAAAAWQYVPDVRHAEMTGELDAQQPSMMYQIPVDFPIQGLDLSLHGSGGDGPMPVMGQLELVSPMGVELEQVGPAYPSGQFSPQAIAAWVRNASAGDHLDVLIDASAVGSATGNNVSLTQAGVSDSTSQSDNWYSSFTLDVQRQDASTVSQDTGFAAQGRAAIGTLVGTATVQGLPFLASASDPAPADPDTATTDSAAATTTAVASQTPATSDPDSETEPSEGFNLRVSTGPFASRSASPLGPTLASVDDEATQPVSRHERALSQEIDGMGIGDGVPSAAWRSRDGAQETDSPAAGATAGRFDVGRGTGAVVVVAGRGGFPLKVTSVAHGERAGLAALWATLPSDSELSSPAAPDVSINESPTTKAVEPVDSTNYVRAAFGLALGVGLMSGPLLPDLVASAPRRLPRLILAWRPRRTTKNRQVPAEHPRQSPITRSWLGGLFGRRLK
jgi:hypothetical protein